MSAAEKPLTKIVELDQQEIAIRSIEILPDLLQTRARTDAGVVKVYSDAMAAGSIFPPVDVFKTPDGRTILSDGFHRVEARRKLGLRSIKALIRPGTMEDAILHGIERNMSETNIREVKGEDRTHAVKLMIRNETFRTWSDTEISNRCGVSFSTVKATRIELRDKEGIDLPTKVMRFSNGKPTNVMNKYQMAKTPQVRPTTQGRFSTSMNNKEIYLGSDRVEAEKQLETMIETENATRRCLFRTLRFREWLTHRSILTHSRPGGSYGGLLLADSILIPIGESTYDELLRQIGRATLIRGETQAGQRIILVCYIGSGASEGRIVSDCRRLTPPIEFMTPDEVVAEFGPKDGETPATEPPADD